MTRPFHMQKGPQSSPTVTETAIAELSSWLSELDLDSETSADYGANTVLVDRGKGAELATHNGAYNANFIDLAFADGTRYRIEIDSNEHVKWYVRGELPAQVAGSHLLFVATLDGYGKDNLVYGLSGNNLQATQVNNMFGSAFGKRTTIPDVLYTGSADVVQYTGYAYENVILSGSNSGNINREVLGRPQLQSAFSTTFLGPLVPYCPDSGEIYWRVSLVGTIAVLEPTESHKAVSNSVIAIELPEGAHNISAGFTNNGVPALAYTVGSSTSVSLLYQSGAQELFSDTISGEDGCVITTLIDPQSFTNTDMPDSVALFLIRNGGTYNG